MCARCRRSRGLHPELYDAAASAADGDGPLPEHVPDRGTATSSPGASDAGELDRPPRHPAAFRHWPRVWMRLCDAGTKSSDDSHLKSDLAMAAKGCGAGAAAAWHSLGLLAPNSREAVEPVPARRRGRAWSARLGSGAGDSPRVVRAARSRPSGRRDMSWTAWIHQEGSAETDRALELAAWDLPTYPAQFDDLRVEWERAAWLHAGDPAGEVAAKRSARALAAACAAG